jgi:hypothetical protein
MKIDDFSPAYIGEDKIILTLDQASSSPRVFSSIQVNIDYSETLPEGVAMPLELIVQGPTEAGFVERTYRKFKPESVSFKPIAAGEYLVLLREVAHNRWVGRLRFVVTGDEFERA